MSNSSDAIDLKSGLVHEYLQVVNDLVPAAIVLDDGIIVDSIGDISRPFGQEIPVPVNLNDLPECQLKSQLLAWVVDRTASELPYRVRQLENGLNGSGLVLIVLDDAKDQSNSASPPSANSTSSFNKEIPNHLSPEKGFNTHPFIWMSDSQGLTTQVCEKEAAFTGLTVTELAGDGWQRTIHPDDLEACKSIFIDSISNHTSFCLQYRMRRFDGEYIWFQVHAVPRFDEDGVFLGHNGLCIDISTQVETQSKLAANQTLLKSILDHSPFLAAFADTTLTYQYVNNSYAKLWDRSRSEIVGQKIEVITGDFFERLAPSLDRVLTGETVYHEKKVSLDNGETKWLEITHIPQFDADQNVVGFYCFVNDATESREDERVLSLVQKHASSMIILLTKDLKIRYANAEFCNAFDIPECQVNGKSLIDVFGKSTYEQTETHFAAAANGEKRSFEVVLKASNSQDLNVLIKLVPELDADGALAGICALILDVSDLRNTQLELERSQARFNLAMQGSSVGIIEFDSERDDWFFADHIEKLLGHPPGHFENSRRRIREFIHPEDSQQNDLARRCMREGKPTKQELRLKNDKGEYRWFKIFTPPNNARSMGTRVAGTITDIDELKKAQLDSEQQLRRRDEFLAVLSHELRNPLAAIMLSLDGLELEHSAEEAAMLVEIIKRQSNHISKLLEDLLDVSRITHNRIEYKKRVTDFNQLVENSTCCFQSELNNRQHQLILELSPEPLPVFADESRMGQMIGNLVENAIKYTPNSGKITITTSKVDDEAVVSFKDNGNGISPNALKNIFDMFFRVESSGEQHGGGLGVGLYLVRQIVEAHQGQVTVESEGMGLGSEFIVRIPLTDKFNPTEESVETRQGATHQIVVVEDNDDARQVVSMLLRRSGYKVTEFRDGETASSAIPKLAPRISIIDIGLPGKSGLQLATELKANPLLDSMKIIAMTGYGQQNDRDKIAESGFDAHLVKPISYQTLVDIINQVCESS